MKIIKEIFINNENNETILSHIEEIEIDEPTIEDQIAERESQLLKMYAELQALKEKQTN